MAKKVKVVVQGIEGCFHDEAARRFFGYNRVEIVPAHSFNELAQIVKTDNEIHYGIMAIENSIAGSILQNYRILREYNFWITGEEYLRIEMNLMSDQRSSIDTVKEVYSHPMAINQCLHFFKRHPHIKLIEAEDTALAAKNVSEMQNAEYGAIASHVAAKLYGLKILAEGIESSKTNYTRFFIISNSPEYSSIGNANKASIYLRVPDKSGSLLKVLQVIANHGINISKLQSYPVLNQINQYYFYLDLEFSELEVYESVIDQLKLVTVDLDELGIYKKADIHEHITVT